MTSRAGLAFAALLEEGLESWSGLPAGCSPEQLAPFVEAPDEAPAMADLGMRKALVRFGALAATGSPAELWVSPYEAEVWMVAIEEPPFAPAPAAVRARLGEPALVLDSARGTVAMPGAEWVYPERGMAVFADEADGRVWRVALFPASRPDDYAELYRARIGQRRLPRLEG
jgi:hypothetical protein